MPRIPSAIAVLCLLGSLSASAMGSPEGDRKRFEKKCSQLDSAQVEALRKLVRRYCQSDLSKGKIFRLTRARLKENGILNEYRACLSAIVNLEMSLRETERREVAEQALLALKKSLSADEVEWVAYAHGKRLEKIADVRNSIQRHRNFRPIQNLDRLGNSADIIAQLAAENSVDRPKEIAKLEQELSELEANDPPFIPKFLRDNYGHLMLGQIGSFETLRVERIVGKSEILTELIVRGYSSVRAWKRTERLYVNGISTSDLVTGQVFVPDGVFKITKTQSDFSETLYLAEPFDVDPVKLAKLSP